MKYLIIPLILISALTVGSEQKGLATWYDGTEISETSQPMASGVWFDRTRYEAAHRTLPFGSKVKVIRQKEKDGITIYYYSTVVIITDRGPCARKSNNIITPSVKGCPKGRDVDLNRIIDLTPVAAADLGMVELDSDFKVVKNSSGLTNVTIEVLELGTCWSWGTCKEKPFERGKSVERQ